MDLAYHGNWLFQLLFGCGKKTNLVFFILMAKGKSFMEHKYLFFYDFFFSAVVLYCNCTFQ